MVGVAAVMLLAACGAEPGAPQAPAPSVSASSTAITFPRLTEGDVTASVKILSFDPAALSAVVEPIIFLPGQEFCATYDLDPLDRRCGQDIVVENSKTRVTLAIGKDAELFTTSKGECVGDDGTGVCRTSRDKFAAEVRDRPDEPARVTVHDGTITRVAQHYQP